MGAHGGGLPGLGLRTGLADGAHHGGVLQVGVGALHGSGDDHLGVVVGVGDRVLQERVHGRDELAPVAHHGDRRRRLVQHDLDATLVRRGPHPLDGIGHHEVHQHRLARRRLLRLDAGQVEQVVDDAADAEGLVVDAAGQALCHLGVGLRDQGLGQQAQGAHRRLELVADVRDEVAADLLEPAALRDVLDQRDHAERAAAVVDLARPHLQCAPGRPVEVERALGRSLVPGVLQDLGDGLGGQGVTVAADHQGVGAAVAVDHGAVLVAEHHALREGVERAPQADGVGAGLGHGLGGPTGHLLEVGQRDLDVALVLGRIEPQAGAEGGQALRDGPAARTPPEPGGDESHQHADDDHARDDHDLLGLAQIDLRPGRSEARPQYDRAGRRRANMGVPARSPRSATAPGWMLVRRETRGVGCPGRVRRRPGRNRGSRLQGVDLGFCNPRRSRDETTVKARTSTATANRSPPERPPGGPGAGSHHGGHPWSCGTWPMSR